MLKSSASSIAQISAFKFVVSYGRCIFIIHCCTSCFIFILILIHLWRCRNLWNKWFWFGLIYLGKKWMPTCFMEFAKIYSRYSYRPRCYFWYAYIMISRYRYFCFFKDGFHPESKLFFIAFFFSWKGLLYFASNVVLYAGSLFLVLYKYFRVRLSQLNFGWCSFASTYKHPTDVLNSPRANLKHSLYFRLKVWDKISLLIGIWLIHNPT